MNDILAQYYRGITQQLRSEVDFINSLFRHQGVKGEGNEAVLRDLITKYIPKRYGISPGIVVDRKGNQSRQCDIVIEANAVEATSNVQPVEELNSCLPLLLKHHTPNKGPNTLGWDEAARYSINVSILQKPAPKPQS